MQRKPPLHCVRLMAASATAASLLLQGCAQLGRMPDGGSVASNPPRLHDERSASTAAKAAAELQIENYYQALTSALAPKGAPSVAPSTPRPPASPASAASTPLPSPPLPPVSTSQPADFKPLLAQGIGLVDSYCLRWFQRLEEYDQAMAWGQKDFNVITQLGTALLGVAKLSSDVTTLYGASTSALSGLNANRQEGMLIAPPASDVKTKVLDAMTLRSKALMSEDFMYVSQVQVALERYADLCTYQSARRMVSQTLKSAEVEKVSSTGEITVRQPNNFMPDTSTDRLRNAWKPDGKTISKHADAALKEFLKERKQDHLSISELLYDKAHAELRQGAAQALGLSNL